MHDWRRWAARITAAVMLGALAWWLSQSGKGGYTAIAGEAFAAPYRIQFAAGPDADALQRAVEAELARIDAMASTWRDDSELMRYNRAEEPERFVLSAELAGLIKQARQIESQTGGSFSLRPDGGDIDLSGIAKGYAVDQIVGLMQNTFGIRNGLVDIGGEVRAFGHGPKGEGWRIALYPPGSAAEVKKHVLQVHDTSVATSGAYFKGGHIIDPKTGKPVSHGLHSASVIHPSNATADALATAMYVMGPEAGLAWAERHTVHVIFLLEDGTQRKHEPE